MKERYIGRILLLIAFSALCALLLISIFVVKEGMAALFSTGFFSFLFGREWNPDARIFGILPFILGSLWATVGALVIGVPVGVGCAIFLAEFVPSRAVLFLKPAIELLAAIPSVVFGFIGVVVLTPVMRSFFGGSGASLLTASCVLGVMILPTIISISLDAFRAVPPSFKEGSIALGATRWQTVRMVLLPAAKPGIAAGVILGMGRAIGETMAVIMVAGNAIKVPLSILAPARTLTTNIALEMGYAAGPHRQALFACGIVLFLFVMVLNVVANAFIRSHRNEG
ncbi:MAG: phosphate ABC transporter permease subunit PstC [Candidatus Ratteibacteria bacterium]|jgi:phosphate transport system permease protein